MARLEAIVAGTGVIPSFGRSLLDEDDLQGMAVELRSRRIPMHFDHDVDQPLEVEVVEAEVRDGPTGDRQLFVAYEVADELVPIFQAVGGMSITFPRRLFGHEDGSDSLLYVDPRSFTSEELAVAAQRLIGAGFRPAGGVIYQLSEFPPPLVVFEFLDQLPAELGWAIVTSAILEGLKVLVRRGRKARYRFVIRKEGDSVTAEIETSSERALADAIRGLKDLDKQNGGIFVREPSKKAWRKAGDGKRRGRSKLPKK